MFSPHRPGYLSFCLRGVIAVILFPLVLLMSPLILFAYLPVWLWRSDRAMLTKRALLGFIVYPLGAYYLYRYTAIRNRPPGRDRVASAAWPELAELRWLRQQIQVLRASATDLHASDLPEGYPHDALTVAGLLDSLHLLLNYVMRLEDAQRRREVDIERVRVLVRDRTRLQVSTDLLFERVRQSWREEVPTLESIPGPSAGIRANGVRFGLSEPALAQVVPRRVQRFASSSR